MDEHISFHLEEYKTLKAEIESNIKEIWNSEKFALAAIAGIFAWLSTESIHPNQFGYVILFVPGALALLLGLRAKALIDRSEHLVNYLIRIEKRLALDGGQEIEVRSNTQLPGRERLDDQTGQRRKMIVIAKVTEWIWILAAIGSFLMAGLHLCYGF